MQEVATRRGLFAEIEDCYLLSYLCRKPARGARDRRGRHEGRVGFGPRRRVLSDEPARRRTIDDEDDAARRYLDEVRRRDRRRGAEAAGVGRPASRCRARARPAVPGTLPARRSRGGAARHAPARRRVGVHRPRRARRVAPPGGTAVKRGLRSLNLWYLRYVTHQVSEFATAVSRALHVLDAQVTDLRRKVDALPVPPPVTVEVAWAHHPGAWWVEGGDRRARRPRPGRVLHAACGDGWLVAALVERGVDAYGVDPRQQAPGPGARRASTCGSRTSWSTSGPSPRARSHAVVLSGVVEGSGHARAPPAPRGAVRCLAPDGVLFVHSLTPASWDADDAPVEADLVAARPYRPRTWIRVLGDLGLDATVAEGPDGRDYLVTGRPRAAVAGPR